jgi:hypothetical protein
MENILKYYCARWRKMLVLTITILFCNFVQSQVLKDTLFFNNGSIVIGKIKNIKLGMITFDPDDANDITVEMRKVKTIIGRSKIFRVETVGDLLYFGTIAFHPEPNMIYIQSGTDTTTVHLADVSILYAFEETVLQRFSGSVGMGFSYTKSSGFGRLNFDGAIKYTSKKEELSLNISGIYTIYDSLSSRDKEEVNTKYNYYFSGDWFGTAFLSYQRNLELGLQRRYQEGFGVGNKFIKSKKVYAWGRTGSVFNQEKSTENVSSGTLSELFGQLEVNFFRFGRPKINIMFAQTIYYGLTQKGRIRNDGATNIKIEVFKDFYLNLEVYHNYDSKPPVAGSSNFDYGVVYGFSYKFY